MSIFENVRSQFVDGNGKTRALNYGNISLATSPLPPLDIPEAGLENVSEAPIQDVLEFVESHKLEIVEQDGSIEDQLVQGVWVTSTLDPPPIAFGYIPVEIPKDGTNSLENIPFSKLETTDPLFVGMESDLDTMRKHAKIANYLKQYSLVEWAQDPEKFSVDNFHIDVDHEYDIRSMGNRIVRGNNSVMYHRNKIIVPDQDTAERLVTFVKVSVYNDPNIRDRYLDLKVVDGASFFTSISDFRREKKQLVFMSREATLQWKMEKSRELVNTNVFSQPRSWVAEPYYFRNLNIEGGKLMIVQNTREGDFPSALAVSKMWETRAINPGYDPDEDIFVPEKELAFEVYTEEGKSHESDIKPTKQNPRLRIFGYDDGSYAAVLFL